MTSKADTSKSLELLRGGGHTTRALLNLLDTQRDILDLATQTKNALLFNSMLSQMQSTCHLIDEDRNRN